MPSKPRKTGSLAESRALRAAIRSGQDNAGKFSLTEFHDRFLASGSAPVKIIRREMLGEDSPVL